MPKPDLAVCSHRLPPRYPTAGRRKDCTPAASGLSVHACQNGTKILLCIRGPSKLAVKGSRLGPLILFALSLSLSLFTQLQTIHRTGPILDLGSDDILCCFSLFSAFISLLPHPPGQAPLSCSTPVLVPKFAVGVGHVWPCVVACEPALWRSLLGEIGTYQVYSKNFGLISQHF